MIFIVVDDDELDRYIVRRNLADFEAAGKLLEAHSGDAFIEEFCHGGRLNREDSTPIVVLMDINMPGMDGFETADTLRQLVDEGHIRSQVIVMMYSSSDNQADRERAKANPIIKDYILKSLDHESAQSLKELMGAS